MRSRPPGEFAAFSLVEAALSLAIISFAMIAIMGLFPVALHTARDSDNETRATFIEEGGSAVGEVVDAVLADGRGISWADMADPEGTIVELRAWTTP